MKIDTRPVLMKFILRIGAALACLSSPAKIWADDISDRVIANSPSDFAEEPNIGNYIPSYPPSTQALARCRSYRNGRLNFNAKSRAQFLACACLTDGDGITAETFGGAKADITDFRRKPKWIATPSVLFTRQVIRAYVKREGGSPEALTNTDLDNLILIFAPDPS